MEKQQLDKLIKAWITVSQSEDGSPEYQSNFWSSECLFKLVDENPEEAWIVIDAIRHATDDNKVLGHLAASHLEDLLATHGEKFIDRFEELAKKDEDFRRLLGGAWQNQMPDELWKRVKAIALPPKGN